jgi:hypothetical protein
MVVTGLESVALPALTHDEVNVTEMGTVAVELFTHTSALTLLVP